MKTVKSILFLLFSILSITCFTQITIGIETGYTKAWENYGNIPLPDDAEVHVTGINVSTLFYYQLSDHFSVGIEPGYVHRGAACIPGFIIEPDPGFNSDTKFRLHYIETPLLLQFEMPVLKDKIIVFTKAGYGGAYLAKAFEETIIIGSDAEPKIEEMELGEGSRLNRWDHGAYGSVGLAYKINSLSFFAEWDGYFGLRDAEIRNTSKNRSFNLNLGVAVQLAN